MLLWIEANCRTYDCRMRKEEYLASGLQGTRVDESGGYERNFPPIGPSQELMSPLRTSLYYQLQGNHSQGYLQRYKALYPHKQHGAFQPKYIKQVWNTIPAQCRTLMIEDSFYFSTYSTTRDPCKRLLPWTIKGRVSLNDKEELTRQEGASRGLRHSDREDSSSRHTIPTHARTITPETWEHFPISSACNPLLRATWCR